MLHTNISDFLKESVIKIPENFEYLREILGNEADSEDIIKLYNLIDKEGNSKLIGFEDDKFLINYYIEHKFDNIDWKKGKIEKVQDKKILRTTKKENIEDVLWSIDFNLKNK